ncbi:DEAD/DEAH box helicase [Candidatus Dojkabacteria bacterium]|uniref:DEAD/DEAH box helicase n=1 Tax=Candidatus Dojkabacteria bacterium TaxID=2099670 RepID=A0A3M0YYY5_9BACT|nr:MAG: DEAD/DEAH box helicase [Candidatus Dojkabacteria bacterium]
MFNDFLSDEVNSKYKKRFRNNNVKRQNNTNLKHSNTVKKIRSNKFNDGFGLKNERFGSDYDLKRSFWGDTFKKSVMPKSNFIDNNLKRRYKKKTDKTKLKGINPTKFIKKASPIEEENYKPTLDFQNLDIVDQLKKNLSFKGFFTPTPIQDQVIPLIMQGRDVFGISDTGTGKTAAFLIPLIDKVARSQDQKVLILTPTRELAEQIDHQFFVLSRFMRIFSVVIVGGLSIYGQISKLKKSHNFVIGTPGRLKDLFNRGKLDLQSFQTIVIDEVDKMLEFGFLEDMKFIVSKLSTQRQMLLFSATSNKEVEEVIRRFSENYIKVSVKTGDTTNCVDQDVIWIESETAKMPALINFLDQHKDRGKILIFANTKIKVNKLEKELTDNGFEVSSLHGDKSQYLRKKALDEFRKGIKKVMVATNVAARGLDIHDISFVLNYDAPENFDDYVHRIGRTGRAGRLGKAFTFLVKQHRLK